MKRQNCPYLISFFSHPLCSLLFSHRLISLLIPLFLVILSLIPFARAFGDHGRGLDDGEFWLPSEFSIPYLVHACNYLMILAICVLHSKKKSGIILSRNWVKLENNLSPMPTFDPCSRWMKSFQKVPAQSRRSRYL